MIFKYPLEAKEIILQATRSLVNKCLKSDYSAAHVFNVFALPSIVQNRPKKGKKRHFPTENLSPLAAEHVMVRF